MGNATAVDYARLAQEVLEASETDVTRRFLTHAFREPTICIGCPDAIADRVRISFDAHRDEILAWFDRLEKLGLFKLEGLIYYKTSQLRSMQNHIGDYPELQQLVQSLTESTLEIHERAMSKWMVTIQSTNPLPRVDPATLAAAESRKEKGKPTPAAAAPQKATGGGLDESAKADIAAKVAAAKAAKAQRNAQKAAG
ncbi:MAG: hypothetical protein HYY96_05580 [Candidatus Tectomicrobia bacterium]|nr:hypothetical protein [Candidatus Tectomicrobia bacterium]